MQILGNFVIRVHVFGMFATLLLGCAQVQPDHHSDDLAIVGIDIIDVETGDVLKRRTLVINSERILDIGPYPGFRIPAGATVIKGKGKYAIPGLWDMHVHLINKEPLMPWDLDQPDPGSESERPTYIPAWVAFGVTGAREMSGGEMSLRMRDQVEAKEIDGPHLVIGSPILDGAYPIWPGDGVMAIANPREARAAVEQLHTQGFDFLKPYTLLKPQTYRALVRAANGQNMEVAGELPLSVSAWDAAKLGQRSIEHMTGLEIACSGEEARLRDEYAAGVAAMTAETGPDTKVSLWNRGEWEPIASIDPEKCRGLYEYLAENDVWVTPTLVTQRSISYPETHDNPYLKYINKWDADVAGLIETFDPERRLRPTYEHRLNAIRELQDAGVGILAGSDAQGGFWLHQELSILVEAGLTPLQALQTATINPARYLKQERDLGSIDPGKFADIIILNGNPLENINNTMAIEAVILKGRLYDRGRLDRMLLQVEEDAKAWE